MSDPQQPARNPHQVPPYAAQSQPGYPGAPQQPAPQQAHQGFQLNGQTLPASQQNTQPGNPPGKVGLIIGLVGLVLGVVINLVVQIMLRNDGYMVGSFIAGIGSLFSFVIAVAALIFGLIGLRRPNAPHAAAGIATGIGLAGAVSIIFNFIINAIGTALYY